MTEQKALSIDEINRLNGYCDKLQKQNKDLQTELRFKKQEIEELSSGVHMIAELLEIPISKETKITDLISNISVIIEEKQQEEQNRLIIREAIAKENKSMGGVFRNNIINRISGV